MPEPAGVSGTFRVAAPVRVGSVTLLPIERVVVRPGRCGPAGWVTASLEPYALVVHDRDGVRVLGIGEAVVSLDELREAAPGLDALLASA